MTRFNPFSRVNGTYGAPMGRMGDAPETYDGRAKLYTRGCGGDGFYDRGGAYWGHGDVFAVWTRGGEWCAYIDGVRSAVEAIARVYTLSGHARLDRRYSVIQVFDGHLTIRYQPRFCYEPLPGGHSYRRKSDAIKALQAFADQRWGEKP